MAHSIARSLDEESTDQEKQKHHEGPIAKTIEQQTAKIPSDLYLLGAVGAMGAAAGLQAFGKKGLSNLVGQWFPAFLILGVYNKMVKLMGSDTKAA